MENKNTPINLTNQESFVKLANEEGLQEITRQDIISLQSKHGIKKPNWLMKNTANIEETGLHIVYLL